MKIFYVLLFLLISPHGFAQLNDGLLVNAPMDANYDNYLSNGLTNTSLGTPVYIPSRSSTGQCAIQLSPSFSLSTNYNISNQNRFSFSFFLKLDDADQVGVFIGRLPFVRIEKDTLRFSSPFLYNKGKVDVKLPLSVWHHVAFTFDSTYFKAYVNGDFKGSFAFEEYFEAFMYIGNITCGIDDLRIYNRVLSASEIVQLRDLPSSCFTTDLKSGIFPLEEKKVLKAYTLWGQEIMDMQGYEGLVMILYSDGSTEKRMQTR